MLFKSFCPSLLWAKFVTVYRININSVRSKFTWGSSKEGACPMLSCSNILSCVTNVSDVLPDITHWRQSSTMYYLNWQAFVPNPKIGNRWFIVAVGHPIYYSECQVGSKYEVLMALRMMCQKEQALWTALISQYIFILLIVEWES